MKRNSKIRFESKRQAWGEILGLVLRGAGKANVFTTSFDAHPTPKSKKIGRNLIGCAQSFLLFPLKILSH
jgi:hypothetical protein